MKMYEDDKLKESLYLDFLRHVIANYPRSDYKDYFLKHLIELKEMQSEEDSSIDMKKYDLNWANKIWNLFLQNNYQIFHFRERCWEIYKSYSNDENSSKDDELIDYFTSLFCAISEYDFDQYEVENFIKLLRFRSFEKNDEDLREYSRCISEVFKYEFLLSEFNKVRNTLPDKTGWTIYDIKTDKKTYCYR